MAGLRGIADGTLDPAAGEVVRQCARHAADLRHSLTGRAPDVGGLLARLRPALRAAEARGALVNVQVIGDPAIPPPRVADAVIATVDVVIGALPPHQVMLTVLGSADDTEVYVTFGEPLRGDTRSGAVRAGPARSGVLARRRDRPGCRPGMPGDQLAEGGAR